VKKLMAVFKRCLLGAVIGIVCGSASALFLFGLEFVTDAQSSNGWLLWFLPFGGALISFIYLKAGRGADRGNNLIIEQIYERKGTIPLRMAPLVLIGTWTTHLFGGSAGREGTAVQMGGSLSEWVGERLKLDHGTRQILLICGISGGFGSIFGTPLAGALFSLELLVFTSLSFRAALPSLIASYVGHYTALTWGVTHAHYKIGLLPMLQLGTIGKVAAAAIAFGLAARVFTMIVRRLKALLSRLLPHPALRSFAGGWIIIALVAITDTREYLGLGLPLLEQSFSEAAAPSAFALKGLFTAVTLSAGFQGGEVTPLFVIGASLGSALSKLLLLTAPFLAAIGMAAVFSSAANTPLAGVVMGIELFGIEAAPYLLAGCGIAYLFSGHSGIYSSQRKGKIKSFIYRK